MLLDYVLYAVPVIAALLTVLQLCRKPRVQLSKYLLSILFCAAYAVVVMFSAGVALLDTLFIMGTAVVAANLIYSYSQHRVDFVIGLAAALAGLAYWLTQPFNVMPFIEAFAVGSLIAVVLKLGYAQKVRREDKRLEKRRDFFQIAMGAVVLLAFLLVPQHAYVLVFLLALLGYAVSALVLGGRLARPLKALERNGSAFGAGAIYMAVGTMLIIGSIPNYDYAVVALIALLICDAVATIVGVHGKHRLPYNREKTLEGALAYFVVLAVLGFPFISYYGLLFAAVLAALESVVQSVDDNIAVPIMAIVLYYII